MSEPTPQNSTESSEQDPANPLGTDPQAIDSISDLFQRDPQEWSEADLDRMVVHLRETRLKIDSVSQAPKKKPAAEKIDVSDKSAEDLLSSLGLA